MANVDFMRIPCQAPANRPTSNFSAETNLWCFQNRFFNPQRSFSSLDLRVIMVPTSRAGLENSRAQGKRGDGKVGRGRFTIVAYRGSDGCLQCACVVFSTEKWRWYWTGPAVGPRVLTFL